MEKTLVSVDSSCSRQANSSCHSRLTSLKRRRPIRPAPSPAMVALFLDNTKQKKSIYCICYFASCFCFTYITLFSSYFEEDDGKKEKSSKDCEYQPASDSSADEEEEEDPLDSFMANIEVNHINLKCFTVLNLNDIFNLERKKLKKIWKTLARSQYLKKKKSNFNNKTLLIIENFSSFE